MCRNPGLPRGVPRQRAHVGRQDGVRKAPCQPDSGMTSQGQGHLSGSSKTVEVLEDKEELVSKERKKGMASERTGRCIQAREETRRRSDPWRGCGKDKLGPDSERTAPWAKKPEFYPLSHRFSNCSVRKTNLSTCYRCRPPRSAPHASELIGAYLTSR